VKKVELISALIIWDKISVVMNLNLSISWEYNVREEKRKLLNVIEKWQKVVLIWMMLSLNVVTLISILLRNLKKALLD
jgi:hypothetical protein